MKGLIPFLALFSLAASCVTSGNEPRSSSTGRAIDAYLAELNDDNFSGAVLIAKDFVPIATRATG